MGLHAVETSSKDSWGAVFETLSVKRELEKAMNKNRSHEGHSTGFIHRKCRGGKVTQFWPVCHDCHEFLSLGSVKKSKVPDWQDLPLMSVAEVDKWRDGSISGIAAKRISDWYGEEWWRVYNVYLKSAAWQSKRAEVIERDGGKCCSCHAPAEHVHHMSYERVGNESLEDLLSVCLRCHRAAHRKTKR